MAEPQGEQRLKYSGGQRLVEECVQTTQGGGREEKCLQLSSKNKGEVEDYSWA